MVWYIEVSHEPIKCRMLSQLQLVDAPRALVI